MGEGADGYVLLWRRMLEREPWISLSGGQRSVMVAALLLANWRDEPQMVAGGMVRIARGSFVSSTRELAKKSGVSHKIARGAITALRASGFLGTAPGYSGTVFTIRKYEEYQDPTRCADQPEGTGCALSDPPVCPERPPVLKKKNKKTKKKKAPAKDPVTNLLQRYYDHFKATHPKPPVISWAGANRTTAKQLLNGPPERTPEELDPALAAYVKTDDRFYRSKGHPFALFPSWLQQHENGQLGLPGYAEDPEDSGWDIPEEERQRFRRRG